MDSSDAAVNNHTQLIHEMAQTNNQAQMNFKALIDALE